MQFAHSVWLIAGLAACTFLGLGFYHFQKKGQAALQRFAAGHLIEKLTESVSPGRRMAKRVLLIIAVASIFVALARPQAGFQWKEVKRKGIDILMAVDTSKSMLANDVRPNRLERSKLGIMDFVSRLEGDRVGLIPFAGTAFLMCPLTLDYDAFRQSLDALDTEIIPHGGTDIASAIREAESAFSNDANHKILVLVTDGEDLEGEALDAAREAARKGMTLYTVGVGSPAGELIPLKKPGKGTSFLKDERGQVVKSCLDEKMLQKISEATGGQYEPLGQQAEGLDAIYKQKLSLVPKHELAERMKKVPIDRFQWPLLLAFILLVVEFAISDRKPQRKKAPVIKTAARRLLKIRKGVQAASAAVAILAFLFASEKVYASPQKAETAYNKGDYSLATKEYKSAAEKAPDNPQLQYNLGTAAYKEKKYDEALGAFQTALSVQNLSLQSKAYYNMGNTLYRHGQGTEQSKPQDTIKRWEESINAYEGALKLDPDDEDARFNQEYVKKKLEELKKKQKQNEKQNQQSCKANNNKDNNQNKNQDGKQGKDQDKNKGNQDEDKSQAGQKNDPQKDKNPQKGNNQKQAKAKPDNKQQEKGDGQNSQATAKESRKEKEDHSDAGDSTGKQNQLQSKEKAQGSPAQRNVRRQGPGQMTEEQAQNLLDSLKGQEKSAPLVAGNNNKGMAYQEKKRRDW
ncbi:MAG: VWA domain-containing protein [Desulfobacterales bacterium]|nr:VWA domain-containing protein [Desulfobacterales bacterium]